MPNAVPRPWAEVTDAILAPVTGVLTDIDDTLTRDGQLDAPAREALAALRAAGFPVIAVTGRPAGWSEPAARDWPLDAVVAENGAVLLRRLRSGEAAVPGDPSGLLRRFTVDDATRAAGFARLQACAADVLARVPGARLAEDSAGRLMDIAVDHSEFHRLDEAGIAAVVAVMHEHGLHATVSSIHVNGWIGEHDKATGAAWAVREVLGRDFDPAAWAYVGDSTNDQRMFARVPVSVGVANIVDFLPRLSVPPAWVTDGDRGRGFAQVARRLLARRG